MATLPDFDVVANGCHVNSRWRLIKRTSRSATMKPSKSGVRSPMDAGLRRGPFFLSVVGSCCLLLFAPPARMTVCAGATAVLYGAVPVWIPPLPSPPRPNIAALTGRRAQSTVLHRGVRMTAPSAVVGLAGASGQGTGYWAEFAVGCAASPLSSPTQLETHCAALDAAGSRGGWFPASIVSAMAHAIITSLSTERIWIGASDSAAEGAWRWTHGRRAGEMFYNGTIDYSTTACVQPPCACTAPVPLTNASAAPYCPWWSLQPDNTGGAEHQLVILSAADDAHRPWNDGPLDAAIIWPAACYACERSPCNISLDCNAANTAVVSEPYYRPGRYCGCVCKDGFSGARCDDTAPVVDVNGRYHSQYAVHCAANPITWIAAGLRCGGLDRSDPSPAAPALATLVCREGTTEPSGTCSGGGGAPVPLVRGGGGWALASLPSVSANAAVAAGVDDAIYFGAADDPFNLSATQTVPPVEGVWRWVGGRLANQTFYRGSYHGSVGGDCPFPPCACEATMGPTTSNRSNSSEVFCPWGGGEPSGVLGQHMAQMVASGRAQEPAAAYPLTAALVWRDGDSSGGLATEGGRPWQDATGLAGDADNAVYCFACERSFCGGDDGGVSMQPASLQAHGTSGGLWYVFPHCTRTGSPSPGTDSGSRTLTGIKTATSTGSASPRPSPSHTTAPLSATLTVVSHAASPTASAKTNTGATGSAAGGGGGGQSGTLSLTPYRSPRSISLTQRASGTASAAPSATRTHSHTRSPTPSHLLHTPSRPSETDSRTAAVSNSTPTDSATTTTSSSASQVRVPSATNRVSPSQTGTPTAGPHTPTPSPYPSASVDPTSSRSAKPSPTSRRSPSATATATKEIPLPIAAPPSKQEISQGLQTVTSTLGTVAAVSAVAGIMGTTNAILRMAQCASDKDSKKKGPTGEANTTVIITNTTYYVPTGYDVYGNKLRAAQQESTSGHDKGAQHEAQEALPPMVHPLRVSMGAGPLRFWRAAVVGNTVLVPLLSAGAFFVVGPAFLLLYARYLYQGTVRAQHRAHRLTPTRPHTFVSLWRTLSIVVDLRLAPPNSEGSGSPAGPAKELAWLAEQLRMVRRELGWPSILVLPQIALGEGTGAALTRLFVSASEPGDVLLVALAGLPVVLAQLAWWTATLWRVIPSRDVVLRRSSAFTWRVCVPRRWRRRQERPCVPDALDGPLLLSGVGRDEELVALVPQPVTCETTKAGTPQTATSLSVRSRQPPAQPYLFWTLLQPMYVFTLRSEKHKDTQRSASPPNGDRPTVERAQKEEVEAQPPEVEQPQRAHTPTKTAPPVVFPDDADIQKDPVPMRNNSGSSREDDDDLLLSVSGPPSSVLSLDLPLTPPPLPSPLSLSDDGDLIRQGVITDGTTSLCRTSTCPDDAPVDRQRQAWRLRRQEAESHYGHMVGGKALRWAELAMYVCSLGVGVAEGVEDGWCRTRVTVSFALIVAQSVLSLTTLVPLENVVMTVLAASSAIVSGIAVAVVFQSPLVAGSDVNHLGVLAEVSLVTNVVGLLAMILGLLGPLARLRAVLSLASREVEEVAAEMTADAEAAARHEREKDAILTVIHGVDQQSALPPPAVLSPPMTPQRSPSLLSLASDTSDTLFSLESTVGALNDVIPFPAKAPATTAPRYALSTVRLGAPPLETSSSSDAGDVETSNCHEIEHIGENASMDDALARRRFRASMRRVERQREAVARQRWAPFAIRIGGGTAARGSPSQEPLLPPLPSEANMVPPTPEPDGDDPVLVALTSWHAQERRERSHSKLFQSLIAGPDQIQHDTPPFLLPQRTSASVPPSPVLHNRPGEVDTAALTAVAKRYELL